jgi:hypothetical protein
LLPGTRVLKKAIREANGKLVAASPRGVLHSFDTCYASKQAKRQVF